MKKNNQKTSVIGHAIISQDCYIADSTGSMPFSLRSVADWKLFQEDLNNSDLVVMGRSSYEKFPNNKRNRLIPTSQVSGYQMDDEICYFNPNDTPIDEVLLKYETYPEKIAIAGGQRVYQLIFEQFIYTEFHLSIKEGLKINEGVHMLKGLLELDDIDNYMKKNRMYQSDRRRLDSNTIQIKYSIY